MSLVRSAYLQPTRDLRSSAAPARTVDRMQPGTSIRILVAHRTARPESTTGNLMFRWRQHDDHLPSALKGCTHDRVSRVAPCHGERHSPGCCFDKVDETSACIECSTYTSRCHRDVRPQGQGQQTGDPLTCSGVTLRPKQPGLRTSLACNLPGVLPRLAILTRTTHLWSSTSTL